MTVELTLMVLWISEESQTKFDAGVELDPEDIEYREFTFYQIANIYPYGNNLCMVASNGEDYIVNESYQNVKQKIKDQMVFKWN